MGRVRVRMVLAFLIGIMPTNILRVFFYQTIFSYRFYQTYIGWRTIIAVDDADFTECQIGSRNVFVGPMHILIDKDTTIQDSNIFNCPWWSQKEKFKTESDRLLFIGKNVLITSEHHFELAGAFILGHDSQITGCGSQFWTHGEGIRNIIIGENCHIGGAVRFAPGSSIGNNSIVGLGSVVTQKFNSENVFITGDPAKIVSKNYISS